MKSAKFCLFTFALSLLSFLFLTSVSFAQLPASQTIGGINQQDQTISKDQNMNRLIKEKKARISAEKPEEVIPNDVGEKVLIKSITVENVTLLTESEIKSITNQYEGQKLSLKGMQKIADLITDEYRKKGYATSRAYIPQQTMKDGLLVIRVVEGRLGNLSIEGNRYFKTSLLKNKINLGSNGYFDYSALQKSMIYINEAPDRTAKVVLMPGKMPGTTDVLVKIKDNYPFHVTLGYDNYGSRYVEKDRYAVTLEHNNLLGFDDKLLIKVQDTEAFRLQMFQARYIFPVNEGLKLGTYFVRSRSSVGQEFINLGAGGKADIIGIFANKILKQTDDLDLRLNLGFDYKNIQNELNSVVSSEDDVRVLKTGIDFDYIDRWGRNILTAEYDVGFPDFMGGMEAKDPNASRLGAGGKFHKVLFNYFRLQPMPFKSSLLWKNTAQFSNYNLLASEQFQIGGATSVRAYPPAEFSGDKGYYTSLEWSMPIYGLSKDMKVPFREEKLYDALRWVFFYDLGFVNTKTLSAGDVENMTLQGWGYGARLNLGDDLALRVEIGYPTGSPTPTDSDHAHAWIECISKF